MQVTIKFKNGYDIFEDVIELHYNYGGTNRTAVECENTGYTYDNKDIKEITITESKNKAE